MTETRTAPPTRIRLGTRASTLAMTQSGHVAALIEQSTGIQVDLVKVTTHGDVTKASLASLGGTGVFATALREFLLAGECDLVVHSLKDLPVAPYPGLRIGAVPVREDPRDALCARDGFTLAELPAGSRVGTGSPRRVAQLLASRDDLQVVDLRGNVDTRLGKVRSGDLDAVVLAAAGLNRMGRAEAITELFDVTGWPTAPGQGALAVEVREAGLSPVVADALRTMSHQHTELAVLAERQILATLEAGCAAPIGTATRASASALDPGFEVTASVYALDGSQSVTATGRCEGRDREQAVRVGEALADELLSRGAATIAPLDR